MMESIQLAAKRPAAQPKKLAEAEQCRRQEDNERQIIKEGQRERRDTRPAVFEQFLPIMRTTMSKAEG